MNVNKPPAFPLSHSDQNAYNFNINNMTWKQQQQPDEANSVKMFGMSNSNSNTSHRAETSSGPSTSGIIARQPRVKRKSESEYLDLLPTKHFVSEEKMIAHMNGLHLSDNFQPHNINLEGDELEDEEENMESCNVNLSPRELERRLKSASRITVCDEVKRSLQEGNEIIPQLLLNRLDQPCTALILWRPPESVPNLMTVYENRTSDSEEEGAEMDNNNNMDMEL